MRAFDETTGSGEGAVEAAAGRGRAINSPARAGLSPLSPAVANVFSVEGLAAADEYGLGAYVCTRDRQQLEGVPDSAGVLRCPACGYRTDEPGDGMLGDGFDIAHRQFGLRGDSHAWNAMRELVVSTPTLRTAEAVRAAFVDALYQVANVDIDQTEQQQVYREYLDHGGMSGGGIHVEWWRTRGIPLLVERAITRRPAEQRTAAESVSPPRWAAGRVIGDIAIWVILLAIPAALVGGGGWLLHQRAYGTRVEATVIECDSSGTIVSGGSTFRTNCIAQWTIDGRVVVGGFNGGNGESDVGRTVDATVRDGAAYSRALILPIVLIALGLPFLTLPVLAIRRRARRAYPKRAAPSVEPSGFTV